MALSRTFRVRAGIRVAGGWFGLGLVRKREIRLQKLRRTPAPRLERKKRYVMCSSSCSVERSILGGEDLGSDGVLDSDEYAGMLSGFIA